MVQRRRIWRIGFTTEETLSHPLRTTQFVEVADSFIAAGSIDVNIGQIKICRHILYVELIAKMNTRYSFDNIEFYRVILEFKSIPVIASRSNYGDPFMKPVAPFVR